MIKNLFLGSICAALLHSAPAAADPRDTYTEIIKKIEARFEPAEASPGQTVTLKIELKLGEGWITYPTQQPERAARVFVNKLVFPKEGMVTFTGKIKEPEKPTIREEELINVKELHSYPGGGTWECEAIVSQKAPLGLQTVKVQFTPVIHTADVCGPKRKFDLEATIKVVAEPTREKK